MPFSGMLFLCIRIAKIFYTSAKAQERIYLWN